MIHILPLFGTSQYPNLLTNHLTIWEFIKRIAGKRSQRSLGLEFLGEESFCLHVDSFITQDHGPEFPRFSLHAGISTYG